MKAVSVTFLVIFAFVAVSGQGIPTKICPPGEHSVLYCPRQAEPSCDNPIVHDLKYPGACDIPDCFCDVPTVRDPKTKKCVPLSRCS